MTTTRAAQDTPSAKVPPRSTRRTFAAAHERKVVEKASAPKGSPGEVGALHRRLHVLVVRTGGSVGEPLDRVADALGRSRETVKSHLRHLFRKTGTGRQAELIRLLSRSAANLLRPWSET